MCHNTNLPQLQPLGHRLQTFLSRTLHWQRAFNHIAVQQADTRHKVVLAQDIVAPCAPQLQPEGHGWQEVKVGPWQSQRSNVTREQASRERGGRALWPGCCPPHSRTTPATPPGGEMQPGKALAHSQRCPERRRKMRRRRSTNRCCKER